MKRIVFMLGIVLSSTFAFADEMPFYFFRFEPNQYPGLFKSNAEAQKELCKITEKNCALSSPEEFPKYAVLPLYEKADLKSKVIGALVSGQEKQIVSPGLTYKSAQSSFVISKAGIKKDLTHYVSYSSDWINSRKEGVMPALEFDEGDMYKWFYAYLRAHKAVPNSTESYMIRSSEVLAQRSDFTDRWYGLANPDENGGVLWLRYKSDLRSPKFSKMEINEKHYPNFLNEILKQFSGSAPNNKGIEPCRFIDGKLTFVYSVNANPFATFKEMLNRHKGADLGIFAKDKPNICNSKDKKISRYEVAVPLEKIYKNGFLVEGVGFLGIEWKEYVEYQEAYPLISSFSLLKELE